MFQLSTKILESLESKSIISVARENDVRCLKCSSILHTLKLLGTRDRNFFPCNNFRSNESAISVVRNFEILT